MTRGHVGIAVVVVAGLIAAGLSLRSDTGSANPSDTAEVDEISVTASVRLRDSDTLRVSIGGREPQTLDDDHSAQVVATESGTGLAVAVDAQNNPVGFAIAAKDPAWEHLPVVVDYLSTAFTLVVTQPSLVTADPFMNVLYAGLVADLPELSELAARLEEASVDPAYLTNPPPAVLAALTAAVDGTFAKIAETASAMGTAPAPGTGEENAAAPAAGDPVELDLELISTVEAKVDCAAEADIDTDDFNGDQLTITEACPQGSSWEIDGVNKMPRWVQLYDVSVDADGTRRNEGVGLAAPRQWTIPDVASIAKELASDMSTGTVASGGNLVRRGLNFLADEADLDVELRLTDSGLERIRKRVESWHEDRPFTVEVDVGDDEGGRLAAQTWGFHQNRAGLPAPDAGAQGLTMILTAGTVIVLPLLSIAFDLHEGAGTDPYAGDSTWKCLTGPPKSGTAKTTPTTKRPVNLLATLTEFAADHSSDIEGVLANGGDQSSLLKMGADLIAVMVEAFKDPSSARALTLCLLSDYDLDADAVYEAISSRVLTALVPGNGIRHLLDIALSLGNVGLGLFELSEKLPNADVVDLYSLGNGGAALNAPDRIRAAASDRWPTECLTGPEFTEVTLDGARSAAAPDDPTNTVKVSEPVFADVTGDGFEDMIATEVCLFGGGGNGSQSSLAVVALDPDSGSLTRTGQFLPGDDFVGFEGPVTVDANTIGVRYGSLPLRLTAHEDGSVTHDWPTPDSPDTPLKTVRAFAAAVAANDLERAAIYATPEAIAQLTTPLIPGQVSPSIRDGVMRINRDEQVSCGSGDSFPVSCNLYEERYTDADPHAYFAYVELGTYGAFGAWQIEALGPNAGGA